MTNINLLLTKYTKELNEVSNRWTNEELIENDQVEEHNSYVRYLEGKVEVLKELIQL